ncbi:helicase C-terminal domain-containing protein [Jimgerdemannia flammicorona]|uniref:DNA 5'-3' helicase n=1 Tax=Jimgerdemannia flammicorona TaxID=994334 RepID=A0A433DF46_9FUNG|nr:helicase C-terminal domain-containing protein [Jimgerdemannia flammicorona]
MHVKATGAFLYVRDCRVLPTTTMPLQNHNAASRSKHSQKQQASSRPASRPALDPLQTTLSFGSLPQKHQPWKPPPRVYDFTEKTRNPEGTDRSTLGDAWSDWGTKYTIGGVELRFPFKACSGKSLALLCAALAWRESEKQRIVLDCQRLLAERKQKRQQQQVQQREMITDIEVSDVPRVDVDDDESHSRPPIFHDADDDDFQPVVKLRKPATESNVDTSKKPTVGRANTESLQQRNVDDGGIVDTDARDAEFDDFMPEKVGKAKLPKIYYGSRTAEMLDEDTCSYFHNVRQLRSHKSLQRNGPNAIWDIEDLDARTSHLELWRKLRKSFIREAMDINLEGNILILDEAHNIEDAAREASSFEVTEIDLHDLTKELESMITMNYMANEHRVLLHVVESLLDWIRDPGNTYTIKEYERHVNLWSGRQLAAKLDGLGINASTYNSQLKQALDAVLLAVAEQIKQRNEDGSVGERDANQTRIIAYEGDDGAEWSGPTVAPDKVVSTKGLKVIEGTRVESEWVHKLGFWCLNPGVTFHAISTVARSIILTSGTLSPMQSFASELQLEFPIRLEANHVIGPSQVWAGVVPVGPGGVEFSGTFKNVENLNYQDDLGEVEMIPFGVLCFMPSYNGMEKFIGRWKITGLYKKISQKKFIIEEPQNAVKSDFEKELNKFYSYVEKVGNGLSGEKDGALFFAVYRGKVSEGIDFSDNNCRAVIAIGIPYPHVYDIQVKLKRDYNETKSLMGRKLLSGSAWYDIQAYRGAIILLEHRFLSQKNVGGLSKWIRGITAKYDTFEAAVDSLDRFTKKRLLIAKGNGAEETTKTDHSNEDKEYIGFLTKGLTSNANVAEPIDAEDSIRSFDSIRAKTQISSFEHSRNSASSRSSFPSPSISTVERPIPKMLTPDLLPFQSRLDSPNVHNNAADTQPSRQSVMQYQPKQSAHCSEQEERLPLKVQFYSPKSATTFTQNSNLPTNSSVHYNWNPDLPSVMSNLTTPKKSTLSGSNIEHYGSASCPTIHDLGIKPISYASSTMTASERTSMPKTDISNNCVIRVVLRCRLCQTKLFNLAEKSSANYNKPRCIDKSFIKQLISTLYEAHEDGNVDLGQVRVFEVPEDAYLGNLPFASLSTNNSHVQQSPSHLLVMPVKWCPDDHLCYAELYCNSSEHNQIIIGVKIIACDSGSSEEDKSHCGKLWIFEKAVVMEDDGQTSRSADGSQEDWGDDLVDIDIGSIVRFETEGSGVLVPKKRKAIDV